MTDLALALDQARDALGRTPGPAEEARVGALLAAMGRSQEALVHLGRSLARNAAQPEVLNNLGAVLRNLGHSAEALAHFERALALAPEYQDARYNLAGALGLFNRYPEAMLHYERLLQRNPGSAEIHSAYGKALWKTNRLDEAVATLRRAVELDPDYPDTYGHLGNALTEIGRLDEAVAAFERAIALAPGRGDLYRFLTDTRPAAITQEHVASLEAILGTESASLDNRIEANFALGKIYAHRSDPERSVRHLTAANAERRPALTYDESETMESFERIAATFDTSFLRSRRGCSIESPLPIFIIGMPRSGTTLIEQILASHPGVFAAGELSDFEDVTTAVLGNGEPIRPNAMLDATCERLSEIGRRYVDVLSAAAPAESVRVTDKMPSNFRYAGLIHTVLPNARILHARRDPVDTCLSIFSAHFAGDMPWAYDLAELGRYYRGYARVMEHWRAVLPPDAMLEVDYEAVVADVKTQARRIVAYCGLEWDPACLEFYKNDRPVRTASAAQVRSPIYTTSVNRSQGYAALLEPLLNALK